jgi:transaldolase
MNPALQLNELGQSLWLDNITRGLLTSGTLEKYIRDYDLKGLTSNPSIFEAAIHGADFYDKAILERSAAGEAGEALFLEMALEDLRGAADLFLPMYKASQGHDGWVSMEVSPLLVHDAEGTLREAKTLHERLDRPNAFIKIPGTPEGVKAIEEAIFAGIPVNVTLLFSREQYLVAAEAYLRGIERRIEAGLDPKVASVASIFVSRWDTAVKDKGPEGTNNTLGIAMARRTYVACRELLASQRWKMLAEQGALPQRLLWASTGTKDPAASDVLYVTSLTAPNTINTMPEKTMLAFADHGVVNASVPPEGGDAEKVIGKFADAGIDTEALAEQLQREGAEAFSKSWAQMLDVLVEKSKA